MRIAKLIFTLAYVTHVSGCIWQIIARIGLSSAHDIRALRKRFPKDFAVLRNDKDRVVSALQKVAVTRNIVRASMAFKHQLRHSPSA